MKNKLALLAAAAAIAFSGASAQGLSANEVVNRLEATTKALKDVSMRVTGTASGADQKLKLDLDIKAISALDLVRITFRAPESLADNFVIVDKTRVWNYLFLTNQVTVSPRSKASFAGTGFDLGSITDLNAMVPRDKVNYKLVASNEKTPAGATYVLEATPKANSGLDFDKVKVWVLENGFRPYRVQFSGDKNATTADLTIVEWKANTGLKEAALRAYPKDAEVINKK